MNNQIQNQVDKTEIKPLPLIAPKEITVIKETTVSELFTMMLKGKLKLFDKEVKAQKFSGVIYIPKKYVGRKVILIMDNEN